MSGSNKPPVHPHNPYASAAGTYDKHARSHATDPREVEARVLLKAAKQLQDIQNGWEGMTAEHLDEALRYNRQIWMMFLDTAVEDKDPSRPVQLRNNIANLGNFVFKQTLDVLSDPRKDKLNILIEINREIAAGLMTRPPTEAGSP